MCMYGTVLENYSNIPEAELWANQTWLKRIHKKEE